MRSSDSQFFCIVRQTEHLFLMVHRVWQLLPVCKFITPDLSSFSSSSRMIHMLLTISVLVNDRRSSNACKFSDFIVRFSRRDGFCRYALVDRFHERNARINSQSARPVSFQILRARSACSGSTLVSKTTKAKVSANSGPDRRTKPI